MRVDYALIPVTALLAIAIIIWALICVRHTIYLCLFIKREQGPTHLAYFNGPWATRMSLCLVAILWAAGEITLVALPPSGAQEERLLCKLYVPSTMGFSEPGLLLVIALLLSASLCEIPGALAPRWNSKALRRAVLLCLPLFLLQSGALVLGENLLPASFRWVESSLSAANGGVLCSRPLLGIALVGFYEVVLAVDIFFSGVALVSLTVNKGLKRRVRVLVFLVVGCVPLRALLLGTSLLLDPAGSPFHVVVFSAFFMFLCCSWAGLWVLVYCPAADSLSLRRRLPCQLSSI